MLSPEKITADAYRMQMAEKMGSCAGLVEVLRGRPLEPVDAELVERLERMLQEAWDLFAAHDRGISEPASGDFYR